MLKACRSCSTLIAVTAWFSLFLYAAYASAQVVRDGLGRKRTSTLLIVTPEAWRTRLAEYVQLKRAIHSINVEVCTLEQIRKRAAEPDAHDEAEIIKRFLYDRWLKSDGILKYVLLVGDADVLPVRYMVLDRNTDPAFNYAFYPSDLYYADLADEAGAFDDWNAAADDFHGGYFGEVRGEHNKTDPINYDGISYVPEIAVGRWPVSTDRELQMVIDKSIPYSNLVISEKGNELTNRLLRAVYVATGDWIENREMMDQLRDEMPPMWTHARRYFADDQRDDQTPTPDRDEIERLLNEGVDLVFHSGHGSDSGWHASLDTGSIGRLTNRNHLPIVLSAGCSTARFATLPPYEAYIDIDGVAHAGTNSCKIGDWAGDIGQANLPDSLIVDYVRVYEPMILTP